jgi:hypothetical protein
LRRYKFVTAFGNETCQATSRCGTKLSDRTLSNGSKRLTQMLKLHANGAQGRNRTTDTAIFSRMLYQLSYLGRSVATLQERGL